MVNRNEVDTQHFDYLVIYRQKSFDDVVIAGAYSLEACEKIATEKSYKIIHFDIYENCWIWLDTNKRVKFRGGLQNGR